MAVPYGVSVKHPEGVGRNFLTHSSPNPCAPQGQIPPDLEPLRSPFPLGEDTFLFSLHGQWVTSPSCSSVTCCCPLTSPRAWTPGWGESREAQPHCKQEQEQVVSSSHPTPSEAESCFPMSPAHELLHLPFRSPQCSPHLGNKLAET